MSSSLKRNGGKLHSLVKDAQEEEEKDESFKGVVPFWSWTDFDDPKLWKLFMLWRLFQALFLSTNMAHPDEYW